MTHAGAFRKNDGHGKDGRLGIDASGGPPDVSGHFGTGLVSRMIGVRSSRLLTASLS